MAAGVVPVVARVGGQEEIVSPDAGVLIPHGVNELQEYVDAIRHLISNPVELQQMSKKCKALAASKLSWDGMIDNFLALLNEAHQLRTDHPRYPISQNFGRELVLGNIWLTSQRDAWEKTAAEREQSIVVLQAQVQDLQTGNAWLTSQRDAWENAATERGQNIATLTSHLQNAAERLAKSEAVLNKIRSHWGMRLVNCLSKTKFF
jgi:hypothetical protein